MNFIMTIINILISVCLVCSKHKLHCMCGCLSSDPDHMFKCLCGGTVNWYTNRECPNCNDYVLRHINPNTGKYEYELYQGQCLNCGQYGHAGNNIRVGWCMKCRDIEYIAEQNRLEGCLVDEDEINALADKYDREGYPCDSCDASPSTCSYRCIE